MQTQYSIQNVFTLSVSDVVTWSKPATTRTVAFMVYCISVRRWSPG